MPIFKSLRAEFHKLADGDVLFRTTDGRAVTEAVIRADQSGERVTLPVRVVATVPSDIFLRMIDEALERSLRSDYLRRVRAAEYHTALCLVLEVDRKVTAF